MIRLGTEVMQATTWYFLDELARLAIAELEFQAQSDHLDHRSSPWRGERTWWYNYGGISCRPE